MNRHQRTLVALSGTPSDHALVRYARLLATLGFARHYYFVHVRTPFQRMVDPQSDRQALAACESLVGDVFGSPRPNLTSSVHTLDGSRVDQLIDFIHAQRCDMVLLGHRKDRSGQRSLARRLAMIAPCSLLMVPEGAPVAITEIMAPTDFSDHSADSVEVAASIARAAGLSSCVVTHVFSDPAIIRYDEHVDEMHRNKQAAFDKFVAPLQRHGIELQPFFLEGNNVARSILHAAQRHESDLMVMNTRGRSRAASILLGSVTTQVMIESPIAVLAVKHFGAMMNLFQALKESHLGGQGNAKTN
ncbi:MAG: universal stress protein [Planctomycetes bacterium]|nr:universal stress protein [Planctomycetota bacterium]